MSRPRQKQLAAQAITALNAYARAQEYAHFGSELALESQKDLQRGKRLIELFNQTPDETYGITDQLLMLDVILNLPEQQILDVHTLKSKVREIADKFTDDKDFEHYRDELLSASLQELKK